jgi:hypothetical protein
MSIHKQIINWILLKIKRKIEQYTLKTNTNDSIKLFYFRNITCISPYLYFSCPGRHFYLTKRGSGHATWKHFASVKGRFTKCENTLYSLISNNWGLPSRNHVRILKIIVHEIITESFTNQKTDKGNQNL